MSSSDFRWAGTTISWELGCMAADMAVVSILSDATEGLPRCCEGLPAHVPTTHLSAGYPKQTVYRWAADLQYSQKGERSSLHHFLEGQ